MIFNERYFFFGNRKRCRRFVRNDIFYGFIRGDKADDDFFIRIIIDISLYVSFLIFPGGVIGEGFVLIFDFSRWRDFSCFRLGQGERCRKEEEG